MKMVRLQDANDACILGSLHHREALRGTQKGVNPTTQRILNRRYPHEVMGDYRILMRFGGHDGAPNGGRGHYQDSAFPHESVFPLRGLLHCQPFSRRQGLGSKTWLVFR